MKEASASFLFWIDEIGSNPHHDQQLGNHIRAHDNNTGFWEVLEESADGNRPIRDEKQNRSNEYLPKGGSITFFESVSGSSHHADDDYDVNNDRDFQTTQVWIDQIVGESCGEVDGEIEKEGSDKINLLQFAGIFLSEFEANDVTDLRH